MVVRSSLSLAAIGLAVLMALPATGASFSTGGADCTHAGRTDAFCPSIGAGTCRKQYKTCKTAGPGEQKTSICTEGAGSAANGCGGNSSICGAANHASDDTNCTKVGV